MQETGPMDQDTPDAPRAPQQGAGRGEPVLILAPTGRDAAVAMACLHTAGIPTHRCQDVAELCARMDTAAAALLADEALPALALDVLRPALQRQPVWSDCPLLLLTSSARATEALWQRVQALGAVGHVTVLERPLTPVMLLSTIQVALQARRRQHELRQLHEAQQQHLAAQAALLAQLQARDQALQDLNATLEQQVTARTAALRHEMAERQRLEREAQRVQHFALLGRLAAGVSHEIRNPLGAIFLQVDVVEEELRDPGPASAAEIATALTEIRTNLERLNDLVQDYLSLVRVGEAQLVPADLGLLVTQWAQEMTAALAAQGITLQLEAVDHLGLVALHANTFRRVLVNLVDNARDAMPQGGTVTLRGRRHGATVHLDVEDTGMGIPPERYSQIFEPLHTTKPGGTGLGLYIVQEVMAAHGGQIAVQSTVGAGTTFTLTLPGAGAGATT
jgi:signal transduction histidine kinase